MAHPLHSPLPANPPKPRTEGIAPEAEVVRYIDLKLAALRHSTSRHTDSAFFEIARPLLRNYHQKDLMLGNLLCPADRRIQAFLDDHLKDVCPRVAVQIPGDTFVLDRPGLACPPLKALLHIMAHGTYEEMKLDDPSFRELFDREAVLQSD